MKPLRVILASFDRFLSSESREFSLLIYFLAEIRGLSLKCFHKLLSTKENTRSFKNYLHNIVSNLLILKAKTGLSEDLVYRFHRNFQILSVESVGNFCLILHASQVVFQECQMEVFQLFF